VAFCTSTTACAQGLSDMVDRTRIVRWLRVLLPLAALVILSTLFLFSRTPDTEPSIPYAEVDAEKMARDPRLIAPKYNGVTSDGAELSLIATEAAPRDDGATARDLQLDLRRADGLTTEVTAPDGAVGEGRIGLSGGVHMTTSSGWTMRSPRIEAATDRSHLVADEGVEAQAPFGEIRADRMELTTPGEDAETGKDGAVLNFSGGVRLIYQP
jgi:lipopolysaccharide export system protein LptC